MTRARRPLAFVICLLIILTTAAPALAGRPHEPGRGESDHAPGRLKHAKLDSELVEMVQGVKVGGQSAAHAARSAKLSRGESVAVSIRTLGNPVDLATWLGDRGATVANVGVQTIEAYVPVTELESLGSRADALSVRTITPPQGRIVSQGVSIHGAPNWHSNALTGGGVKIGVIDVGFDGLQNLVGSELPTPIVRCYQAVGMPTNNLADCSRLTNHGTAVAETVMDVAPEASLYIANPQTSLDLQATVDWMAAQGVQVINHSVGWVFEGPGDGTTVNPDGVLAAVDKAVAAGITWVNAGGNEALSNWTGGYLDGDADGFIEFAPGDELNGIATYAGAEMIVQLRWDDSWTAAGTDLDVHLVDDAGNLLARGNMTQNGSPGNTPFEKLRFIPSQTGRLHLRILHWDGPAPAWIQVQAFSGEPLEHAVASYSISNPGESRNAGLLAVGASNWQTPNIIEQYSSQGPTRDGRIKPDLVGVDYADTVTYGPNGFPGTSQSAPHVAGLAALVKQRFPDYGPAAVANYLRGNASVAASCTGAAPNNTWGYGFASLQEIEADESHPCPAITGISPDRTETGTQSFTLTVDGANFVPESVVRVNGEDRPTTFVNGTQLHITVLDTDLEAPQTIEITVQNPEPGGGLSNVATLTVEIPSASDHDAFTRTWARTDYPVEQLAASRTWMWGEGPRTGPIGERYAEAPAGMRAVKYYDKSRMEINDPKAPDDGLWFVTNGLLAKELITGRMQIGSGSFEDRKPAEVNLAGDPDDPNGPTYATFGRLLDDAPLTVEAPVIQRVDRYGDVRMDEGLEEYGVIAVWHVPETNHTVASPFWDFMTSSGLVYESGELVEDALFENPFYATGFPITEAYWARVTVAGAPKDVLTQCFERRCLTYTPDNPPGWQVEAGNVGLHYYIWRYGQMPEPSTGS